MVAMHLHPWHILVVAMAGWMNREQSAVIEFLKEENRVLRVLPGQKWPRLNDDQRRRLAAKGKTLGGTLLATCCCIVMPDTILRWHRKLIAKKYDGTLVPEETRTLASLGCDRLHRLSMRLRTRGNRRTRIRLLGA